MKLIVGGVDRVPGFVTMDISSLADVVADIRLRWPFPNGSVELIFASHVIEHITREEALFAICECSRVMKPGGILRLSTPDLDLFALKYVQRDRKFYEQMASGEKPRFPGQTIGDRFMFVVRGSGHQRLYDFDSLRVILEAAGFVSVRRQGFRQSAIPEIELLDNRPQISLFIEAVRGASSNTLQCREYGKSTLSWTSVYAIKARLLLRVLKRKVQCFYSREARHQDAKK